MSQHKLEQLRNVMASADCLHDESSVRAAVTRLANAINADYAERNPLVMVVMNGGLIPAGWLLAEFDFLFELDYLHASRYRGKTIGDELQWLARPHRPLRDRSVLLIDDILDEGITLLKIREYCQAEGAREVRSAVLVRKQHDRNVGVTAEYIGLEVEDRYVFGCGMDYQEYFRHLPAIYAVSEKG